MCWVFLTMVFLVGSVADAATPARYRGINIAMRAMPVDAAEPENAVEKFAGWGVNLIRLGIRTDREGRGYGGYYLPDGKTFNGSAFEKLDAALDMAAARTLHVIIATPGFPGARGGEIWTGYEHWRKLEELWSYIAKRYRGHPAVLGYHPMDEANVVAKYGSSGDHSQMRKGAWTFPAEWKNTPKDYFALVERVGQAINRIDPTKRVVISGVGLGGKPVNYNWMRPVNVMNAVYAFNFYIPSAFANSGKKGRPVVPYSRSRDRAETLEAMAPVQRFAKRYDADILVTGFGLPHQTEGIGAEAWMEDVLAFFEDNEWSWAYFSYSARLRCPDLALNAAGNLERNEDTERLSVLKKYWSRNGAGLQDKAEK